MITARYVVEVAVDVVLVLGFFGALAIAVGLDSLFNAIFPEDER